MLVTPEMLPNVVTLLYDTILENADELEELRYAALLHDFGKVSVREEVLLKANKLYPWEMERIEWRFRVAALQALAHGLAGIAGRETPAGVAVHGGGRVSHIALDIC